MPKTRKRAGTSDAGARSVKRSTAESRIARASQKTSASPESRAVRAARAANPVQVNRPFLSPPVAGPRSLIFPGMVASGCWLMAYTVIFLTSDPNRFIFGGMAVLMALLWSFSVAIRVRKLLALRQKS